MFGLIRASVRRAVAVTSLLASFLVVGLTTLVAVATAVPPEPTLLATTPGSPSSISNILVRGNAAGTTVTVYENGDCTSGDETTGAASLFNMPDMNGIPVEVANDATTVLSATTTDMTGTSLCSAPITYIEDSTAPMPPDLTVTSPASPANENYPKIFGSAEPGSAVSLYKTSGCTGVPSVISTATELASIVGITLPVTGDAVTTVQANATDAAGNTSLCSSAISYTEDSTAPVAPVPSATDPASPSSQNALRIKGAAEAGSTVRLYPGPNCSGSEVLGSASDFTTTGILVPAADNTTTTWVATATDAASNRSPCSSVGVVYVEDSIAPGVPTITATAPASPANDNAPRAKGIAETGSTVRLYTSSDCLGTPAATGTAAEFASQGLALSVANDTTTSYRASAADLAGNRSGCSAPVIYAEDSTAPGTPTLIATVPASPADDGTPSVKGSADSGSMVRLYVGAGCVGAVAALGSAAEFASTGLAVTVPDDTTASFHATATDAAGNVSACSSPLVYVEQSTPQRVRVTAAVALKDAGGASYIALPGKAKSMTATFSVSDVLPASYHGPVKLRLHFDGLKLSMKLPAGVKLAPDGKSAIWTIGAVSVGRKQSLKGTSKAKAKATFSVSNGGSPGLDVVGASRSLERASGRIKLAEPRVGTLSNGERITFRGTIAAATCDRAGVGRVRLWGQFPGHGPLRSPSKANIKNPPADAPAVCSFSVTTGRFSQLKAYTVRPYRGRPFKFWVISRVDSKSHQSNKVKVSVDKSP
jgi:uncharacterized membrane protein